MTQFSPEDFHDSIDDMCDDALRRMYAFQEGGLDGMLPSDHYFSEITNRDTVFDITQYDTQVKAGIISDIHKDVIEGTVPDYMLDILGGAVMTLAQHAAFRGSGSDVVIPNRDMARSYVSERLLLNSHMIKDKKPVKIISYELGSLGVSGLIIGPGQEAWELYYDAHHRAIRIPY